MSKLSANLVKFNKQKVIPAIVIDVVGRVCSVALSGRGKIVHNISYIGPSPKVGDTVYVNYASGKPVVEAGANEVISVPEVAPKVKAATPSESVATQQHNDLAGLQGGKEAEVGSPAEYYHLTEVEYLGIVEGGGLGGGGHTIQDEGAPLTQRTNLNFMGNNVAVTDDEPNDATIVTVEDVPFVGTTEPSVKHVGMLWWDTDETASSIVSDTAYGISWDGVTDVSPSKNAVYNELQSIIGTIPAAITDYVHDTGDTMTGELQVIQNYSTVGVPWTSVYIEDTLSMAGSIGGVSNGLHYRLKTPASYGIDQSGSFIYGVVLDAAFGAGSTFNANTISMLSLAPIWSSTGTIIGFYGANFEPFVTAGTVGSFRGNYSALSVDNTATGAVIAITEVAGHLNKIRITAPAANAVVTKAYGILSELTVDGAHATLTTGYGNYVQAPSVTNGGTLTNYYGNYIENITAAGTLNYANYTNLGLNRFGDQVAIVGGANRQQLIVTGYTTQTLATTLVQFTRNDAAAGIAAILGLTGLGSGAVGDGGSIILAGKDSTTAATQMGHIDWLWANATHGAASSTLKFYQTISSVDTLLMQLSAAGQITLGSYTLTVPATGIAALLATGNIFTVEQSIQSATGVGALRIADLSNNTKLELSWGASNNVYMNVYSPDPGNQITNGSFDVDLSGWTVNTDSTYTVQPDATAGIDTYLSGGGSATYNYGVATTASIGSSAPILLKFDLSALPAGATCESATLYMYQASAGSGSAYTATVYAITSANGTWAEGTKNGAQAGAGEPCWNALAANGSGGVTTAWAGSVGCATSGTDYESSSIGSWSGNRSDTAGTEYSTALSASKVSQWLAGSNYGMLIKSNATGSILALSDNATAGRRPKISITYNLLGAITRDTSTKYAGVASAKVIAPAAHDIVWKTSVTVPDTSTYVLTAYVYVGGGAVSGTDAQLYYDGVLQTTDYAFSGTTGWYILTCSITGVASAKDYGIKIFGGRTAYVDSVSLITTTPAATTTLNIQNQSGGIVHTIFEGQSILNAGVPTEVGAVVRAAAAQSVDIFEVQDSSSNVLSGFTAAGGLYGRESFVVKTNTYGVGATDKVIVCNSVGGFTVTIPTATGSGRILIIKNIGAGSITVSKAGDTIDGAASQALAQWAVLRIVDSAANVWVIV